MKRFIALILALALALSLCACGDEGVRTPNEPEENTAEPAESAPEEEPAKEEPPIEIPRFLEPDDMPEASFPEFTDESLAIEVDGESYNLGWLYEHNIHDWIEAGISFDQVNDVSPKLLGLDYTDEAFEAIKKKVSDFTEITMLNASAEPSAVAGSIVVTKGDEETTYDLTWLSSNNATAYTEAGIGAEVVAQYLESLKADFWYTKEYRWIEEVYNRLVNGF